MSNEPLKWRQVTNSRRERNSIESLSRCENIFLFKYSTIFILPTITLLITSQKVVEQ